MTVPGLEDGPMDARLPCGCDPMVVEDAESCKRCDDPDCEETDGCERLRAFVAHTLHILNPKDEPVSGVPRSVNRSDDVKPYTREELERELAEPCANCDGEGWVHGAGRIVSRAARVRIPCPYCRMRATARAGLEDRERLAELVETVSAHGCVELHCDRQAKKYRVYVAGHGWYAWSDIFGDAVDAARGVSSTPSDEGSTRAFERNGQGLDDDIETVRYTIGHLKATGHDAQTYIVRDMERVLRNLETVRSRSGRRDGSDG